MWTKFKDRFRVSVAGTHDAAATLIPLTAGHGIVAADLPAYFFWYDSDAYPDSLDDPNFEWVLGTAIAGNDLTVTRAQLGTSASTKNTSGGAYKMIASPHADWFNTELLAHMPLMAQVRLSLEAGVLVSTTDQLARTSIKAVPCGGNRVSLIDGSIWKPYVISSELDLPLGTLASTFPHDVFMVAPAGSGNPTLEKVAWVSETARAEAVSRQDGQPVKTSDPTRLLVGTFKPATTTTTEDSLVKRFLWNNFNRVARDLFNSETLNHSYNGNARQWNNNPANQIEFVAGLAEDALAGTVSGNHTPESITGYALIEMGLDTATVNYRGARVYSSIGTTADRIESVSVAIAPQIGYHFLTAIENTISMGAATFLTYKLSAIIRG